MSIEGIFISELAAMPMKSLERGRLIAGKGIEGDRYAENMGTYSPLRESKLHPGEREPGRQLSILSADCVEAAFERSGLEKPSNLGDLRRNIVVRGIKAKDLLAAVGRSIKIGDTAKVLVHRHCVPSPYLERKTSITGMTEAIWNESGVYCEVLVGGSIAVGDRLEILESEESSVDESIQPPAFHVPPSMRTTEMEEEAAKILREEKDKLLQVDPEGAEKLEKAYESVGLNFWPKE